jgi:hypothetical protein|tara:strand:- start:907 stop:2112 length:1206 start_codon:yes stop_codon:yes gene_type:complete
MAIKTKRKKAPRVRAHKTGAAAVDTSKGYLTFQRLFNANVDGKDSGNIIKLYVRKNFSKPIAQAILKNPDFSWNTQATGAWCYWRSQCSDVPFAEGYLGPCAAAETDEEAYKQSCEYYDTKFNTLAESGKLIVKAANAEEKKKSKVYTPSIQERMHEQLSDIVGEFESWIDEQPSKDIPKMFDWLKTNNVAQAHINKIREYYAPIRAEYELLANMPTPAKIKKMSTAEQDNWEQIKEAYSFLSKDDIKCYIKWFDALNSDLDAYTNLKRATRKTRVKKAPSADKLISKLKYKKDDSRYKVVSVNPTAIVGATELWVFNTKTRKLGKYVAEANQDLSVKGTTLRFFDEKLSVCKTLRRPEEQLTEFGKAGKIVLRKFLENINATETKMNGRLSEHIVLLKVS